MSDVDPSDAGAADALRDAAAELRAAREAVADHGGRERLEAVASALRDADRKLDGYEESATGTGDFQSYVQFQDEFATLVEELDDELPEREAFEAAAERVDKRRLSESDFAAARDALEPARELASVRERLDAAREDFADARRRATDRLEAVRNGLAARERLLELGDADLDAPVEALRDPVETYDDAVTDAFASFRREARAGEVFDVLADAAAYPLVDVDAPPDELREYVAAAGDDHTIPELLEYADYSQSKLEHYVDDPGALRTAVGTRRTYLDRLDGAGFTIGWPPPEAEVLQYVTRELLSVVPGFADEDVAATLQSVRELAWREDYERLRTAAVALDELGPEERDRLASGAVVEARDALERERDDLRGALDDTDDLA
ncbi:hypothetical protein [Halorubellus sp. PRR65]|uniref:DUF7118 family protein n=1 Tax=Halorubellus sp. PRR65 TaxID=3098148 RepID=UPI002B259E34|nr:hypothetical protein [Halorubellus sp. PRR65]